MKRKLIILMLCTIAISGCKKLESFGKDFQSASSGLDRIVNIYPYGGKEPIATYEGKLDLEYDESGRLKFLLDGKRYIYYNVTAEVLEK